MQKNKLDFLQIHFNSCRRLGLPKNLTSDCEVASLFASEIYGNQCARGTSEVVDAVGYLLPDINLPIRVGNLVNDFHKAKIISDSHSQATAPDSILPPS